MTTAIESSASSSNLPPSEPWPSGQALLDALLTASPLAVCALDPAGRVTVWNQGAERLFGLPRQAALGHPFPCSGPAVANLVGEALAGVRHSATLLELDLGCGWNRSVEVSTVPLPAGVLAVFLDVTAQRKVEQALAESEYRFRAIFEQAPIGMAIADLDGHLLEVNAALRKILDLPPDAVAPGWPVTAHEELRWEDLLEPGQPARNLSRLLAGLATGTRGRARLAPALQSDARFRTRSGRLIDVQWNLCLVLDAQAQPVCQIGQVADISRRKSAENKLKQFATVLDRSNQDLQQFAYVASHDLQEPLRMVRSYLELLARRYKGRLDADADEFIGYAVDGASRMQKLISGLLAYSRVGTQAREAHPVEASASLALALANLSVAIEESGAAVSAGPLPSVLADDVLLTQLFQNLIGNSIKFRSEAPPRVTVSARPAGALWRFAVADNGIGLDPQFSDRAFQIFQRLQPADRYPGTGIGLAICKRIVERLGGSIGVDSAPGQGATFWFTLPAALAAPGEAAA